MINFKDKKVANKIFEFGCKFFGHVPEYLLSYYEFLTHVNGITKQY